jgi:DNA polymerase-1
MSEARKKLAIIDGKSVFYRGYYAMPNLSTKDGVPTGGVYGFLAMALELVKKYEPDYVCVAWDKPKTNIRKRLELYPEYKAGRKPAPADFYTQIPILHEALKAFSWPLYEYDDYEADDIMYTLSKKADDAGLETMLISSDLDMLQAVGEHTHMYALKKGFSNIERFDIEYFEQKHGIEVEQFLDLKALKGDSSDNIPGVPGVGEKTAVQLLNEHKTLDGIYDNLALIKDSVRRKLEAGRESAYLSKEVARLFDDAPAPLDLQDMDTRDLDVHALRTLLAKLEFRSLLRTLPDYMQVSDSDGVVEAPGLSTSTGEIKALKVININDHSDLSKIQCDEQMVMASMCAGSHGRKPQVLLLANKDSAYVLDINKISAKKILEIGQQISDIKVVGYDLKSSFKVLIELGIDLPEISHDVLVGAFLINPIRREKTLSELVFSDLGYEGSNFDDMSPEDFVLRSGELSAVIWALENYQSESISELTKVIQLANEVEWPVIPVLARMEFDGIGLDKTYLDKMSEDLSDKISDIEQTIYGYADQEFNISSPSQLSEILFENLSLPTSSAQLEDKPAQPWTVKKGKTGSYSTANDVLQKLKPLHPIIEAIEAYREYTKLKSTYVDALPKLVDDNGFVHTTFNLTTAATGRLSSVDPNLQNIPVRTELGKKIRTAFVPRPGNVFVSADYSQFELRIAAALSGDDEMIKAFDSDQDIHQLTAASVMGVDTDEVTKDMRYRAKAVNFGILYGQGPHALADQTGMSFGEAKDFINRYFTVRPKLKGLIERLREQAKNKGFVETVMGRRRPTPDVQSSNFVVREAAFRQAVNMPIQGTAADLTKLAMIKVKAGLTPGAKMLLQIHDSIMIECPVADANNLAKMMKDAMENIYPKLGVKLKVDVEIGKNWGEL